MDEQHKDKPKDITVSLPPDLHEILVRLAKREYRSLKSQVVWMLRRDVEQIDVKEEQDKEYGG